MSLWSATAALLLREGRALADFLFPACCALCQALLAAEEEGVCGHCLDAWPALPPSHCPRCAEPFPAAAPTPHFCPACLKEPPPFAGLWAGGLYADGLRQAIHQFKYGQRLTLVGPLARQMVAAFPQPPAGAVVCPVPMHPRRLRQRGYNPALLLARALGEHWELPLRARALQRLHEGRLQQGLSAEQRRRNVRGLFAAAPLDVPVVLVDDVCTTTATLRACSQALIRAGVPQVLTVVAGRAPAPATLPGDRGEKP